MALKRTLGLAVLAASLAACSSPRTEIIVAVDSDLAVPDQIDSVTIEVTSPGGTTQSSEAMLGAGQPSLPRTLGLAYEGGPLGPFLVRAVGRHAGGAVVERRARVSFVLERTLFIRLDLLGSCQSTVCTGDTTCAASGCRPVDVAASELVDWTGSVPPLERMDGGGMPMRDAGPPGDGAVDAGTDAAPMMRDGGPDAGVAGDAGCRPEICNGIDDDCDGMIDDGFDLMTDLANCGRCGNTCSAPHGTASCAAGRCGVSACDMGWGNCDMSPANGCEANLTTSRSDCGMCGNGCAGSEDCCSSMCMPRSAC